jgi:hypothetical protein
MAWGAMKKLKLYLDTTVWNYAFAQDVPLSREETLEFFKFVRAGGYVAHISKVVADKIADAPAGRKKQLRDLMQSISPVYLNDDPEVDRLSGLYISRGVLTAKSKADSMHLAFATYYEMDALISWNFRHLANIRKREKMTSVNIEVLDDEGT